MKTRFIVLMSLVLILVFSFVIPASHAYDCGKAKEGHSKGFDDKFYSKASVMLKNDAELGLSDEQVKKIKDLKVNTKKNLIKAKADIDLIAVDIKAQLWGDVINEETINVLIDKKYDLKKAKTKLLIGAYISLKNILTKEQKKKLKSICQTHKKKKN